MKIRATSYYKNPAEDRIFMEEWNQKIQLANGIEYQPIELQTSLGKTVVWSYNAKQTELESLVVFPGFRTCGLFWELDGALEELREKYRIFLVDVNGQPGLSEGNVPHLKSDGFGQWAREVFEGLKLEKTHIAGASFGGYICLKACASVPEKINKVLLFNPAGIQSVSLAPRTLYYNLLPLISPTKKSIRKFLDNLVFYKDLHKLSEEFMQLTVDYQFHALTRHKNKTQPPIAIKKDELFELKSDIYLILGEQDILFPFLNTIALAENYIPSLKGYYTVPDTGHGIETSKVAFKYALEILRQESLGL